MWWFGVSPRRDRRGFFRSDAAAALFGCFLAREFAGDSGGKVSEEVRHGQERANNDTGRKLGGTVVEVS